MRVVFPEEMAALDRAAVGSGISSLDLMERAGRALAEHARDMLTLGEGKRVSVVAGKGNNGGDGFVAARYLHTWGAVATIYLLAGIEELTPDSATNHRRLLEEGGRVVDASAKELERELEGSDLVIDAVFGTGFRGVAEGRTAAAIEAMNACGAPVLSADVPSGVEADTGGVRGPAVEAARTVTFGWPKVGLYLYPGAEKVGELVVEDIGIPPHLLGEIVKSEIYTVEEEEVSGMLPRRSPYAHKGSSGRVLVVAGSEGLTGAAALCSRSALRAGAGVVTLGVPAALNPILEVKLTEVMTLPLPDREGRCLAEGAVRVVMEALSNYDVLALGPGLGTAPSTRAAVAELLWRVEKPMVLDADGINCAAEEPDCLEEREGPLVLTPHPGELGRLIGKSAREVQETRLDSALRAARRFGCVVVLKGANTVIAEPGGRAHINPLALPGLATAGSGDVLTGCVAALLAQGLEPLQAAVCGVFVHGKAAELATHLVGDVGMVAGDVVSHIPLALSGLVRGKEKGRNG